MCRQLARTGKRSRQRGVAAVEFALGMTLFLPLLFIIIDYGYYFYVSITAVEAARVGARQLWNQSVTSCTNAANVLATRTVVEGATGNAKTYMSQIGLLSATTVTATCTTALVVAPAGLTDPVWQLQVKVDFPLPVPTFGLGIPRSTTPGHGLFTETTVLQGR